MHRTLHMRVPPLRCANSTLCYYLRCRPANFRYIIRVNCLTKQELTVLVIVLGLLLTGWCGENLSHRASADPAVQTAP